MGLIAQAYERFVRDFAGVGRVLNPRDPAGFADGRCAWLLRQHLSLPGVGEEPVLRAARALKAHGYPVDLRDGFSGDGPPWHSVVKARPMSRANWMQMWPDLAVTEPLARPLFVAFTLLVSVAPWGFLLLPSTRPYGVLIIFVAMATRLMTGLRDGFGLGLTMAGWGLEPYLAVCAAAAPKMEAEDGLPELGTQTPPALTASEATSGLFSRWADHAGVPYLARRLGGSARVMEQVYNNEPCGDSVLGRFVDRQVHQSTASRAVRHRLLTTIKEARRLTPMRILSVPCGSARDIAGVVEGRADIERIVLVDPDPWALDVAGRRCSGAHLIEGGLDDLPEERFDLVVYVGLSEYLGDAEVIRHFKLLERRLDVDGRLITSVTDEHPQRGAMKDILGWETRKRSPDAFINLIEMAGLLVESHRADPEQAQWVMVLRKREQDRF